MIKINSSNKPERPTFVSGEVVELTEHPELVVIVMPNQSYGEDLFTGIMVSCNKNNPFAHKEIPFLHNRWVKSAFQKSRKTITFEN